MRIWIQMMTKSLADDLIVDLNYKELTGYNEYDGYYDGYHNLYDAYRNTQDNPSDKPMASSVLNIGEETFDMRSFAVASWERILHGNLNPRQLQPYLGWAPLHVIRKTLEVTTQMAKMVIRYPLQHHICLCLSFM
jgi:hypothetical protein